MATNSQSDFSNGRRRTDMKKVYETAFTAIFAIGKGDILTESGGFPKASGTNRTEWDNVISKK